MLMMHKVYRESLRHVVLSKDTMHIKAVQACKSTRDSISEAIWKEKRRRYDLMRVAGCLALEC